VPLRRLMGDADSESRLIGCLPRVSEVGVVALDNVRLRTLDGRLRWADLRLNHVPPRAGERLSSGMLCLFHDRTAQIAAAEALELTARAKAEHERDLANAASRAKTQLLSRVSHELRTPLNAVLGFAQLLARPDAAMAKVQAQWVGHILASGRHLLALVDDVLDLSAAESGRLRLAPEPVDLQALVAEVLAMTAHDAATAGVRLPSPVGPDGMGGPGGGPPVLAWGDRTRCRQIVANLVSNAVKYNRPGGAVQVRMWAEAGLACLTVQDDGPGIALALRERLFEPFERLEAAQGPVRGTGLGLALSRQLALSMAGSLALTSPPGAGACFELRLPAATGDQRDAATVRLGTPNSPPP
jgi:signal transduction histidine kinase